MSGFCQNTFLTQGGLTEDFKISHYNKHSYYENEILYDIQGVNILEIEFL